MKSIHRILQVFSLLIFISLTSCDALIYDNLEDCETGVSLRFYHTHACSSLKTPFTELKDLRILTFDDQDNLIKQIKREEWTQTEENGLTLVLPQGTYKIKVWSGVDKSYTESVVQKTTDAYLSLSQKENQVQVTELEPLYIGESETFETPRAKGEGSVFKEIAIPMVEKTNRIKVLLTLDESVEEDINNFEVIIRSANGLQNGDGSLPTHQPQLTYQKNYSVEKNESQSYFHVLDLKMGQQNELIIRNKRSNEIIYQGDLLGSILMKNYNINIDCENDFELKFKLSDRCKGCYTFYCSAIWVNDWLIHSYDTELGID